MYGFSLNVDFIILFRLGIFTTICPKFTFERSWWQKKPRKVTWWATECILYIWQSWHLLFYEFLLQAFVCLLPKIPSHFLISALTLTRFIVSFVMLSLQFSIMCSVFWCFLLVVFSIFHGIVSSFSTYQFEYPWWYVSTFSYSFLKACTLMNYVLLICLRPENAQHFDVDMNFNYMVIFINFLFTKLWIFRKTKDFLTPGIDYLSRIWHSFFGILGPQCSSTLYLFGFITILTWASLMSFT